MAERPLTRRSALRSKFVRDLPPFHATLRVRCIDSAQRYPDDRNGDAKRADETPVRPRTGARYGHEFWLRRTRAGRSPFHTSILVDGAGAIVGKYQNFTWVVAVAKAGVEDGHPLFGCSVIVDPDGQIVAASQTEEDELLIYTCDLDQTHFGKETILDFARHRRIEHYGLITSRTGAIVPSA